MTSVPSGFLYSGNRCRQAFTLIELLVVIAIIAILAAILFPVFAQARDKARATACLSNEKQIGLAIQQYVQDFDETWPSGRYIKEVDPNNAGTYLTGIGWVQQVYPYIKSAGLFKCGNDDTEVPTGAPRNIVISYALNANLAAITDADLTKPAMTVSSVEVWGHDGFVADNLSLDTRAPAAYGPITATDGSDGGLRRGRYKTGPIGFPARTLNNSRVDPARHTEGSNFLCADGHAKWARGQTVSSGATAQNKANAQTNTRSAGTEYPGIVLTFSPI